MTIRLLVGIIIVFIVSNAYLCVSLIQERRHEPCGCDTCVEHHYENIRIANPSLKMEAL